VEGTLALRKRQYQKIINEYRRRQRDIGRLITGNASASSAQPAPKPQAEPAAAAVPKNNNPSSPSRQKESGVHALPDATSPPSPDKEKEDDEGEYEGDGDGTFLSWSTKKVAPPLPPTAEGEETQTPSSPDKDEGQDTTSVHDHDDDQHSKKDHCDYMLKVAIGIGRVMHSTAMSLGRNTLEFSIAVDVNVNENHKNPAWTAQAVDLEQRLNDASLSIFGMIATDREQNAHAQFPSVLRRQANKKVTTRINNSRPSIICIPPICLCKISLTLRTHCAVSGTSKIPSGDSSDPPCRAMNAPPGL
jgi:hypothetical protein